MRKENLSATADPLSQINPVTGALGWSGATTLYPFDSGREVSSTFAEVRIPLLKDVPGAHLLEVSGAVRHESYSDTEDPTVPKVTFRYLPLNDEFAFRGTYSKSFSAPALFNLFGPASIGFSNPFTLTKAGGGTVANLQTNAMSGSNPNLQPSNSKNFTLGVVYSPKDLKGFSVSLYYWNIKQTDLVSSIGDTTTPAQQAALDAAALRFAREGACQAVEVVRAETTEVVRQVRAQARAEAKAEAAVEVRGKKLAGAGLAAREDDEIIRTRIAGEFRGWKGQTVFTLENGQVWRQTDKENRFFPLRVNPEVELIPSKWVGWKLQLLPDGLWIRVKRVR